ncbi:MAG: urea transporter [Betaproteobacteria bacterium]|nr:urea transporter [Betaproteobacteria bacterium]
MILEAPLRNALTGLGQVAYQSRPEAGLILLATVALVSPWAGLGAALGALLGSLWARLDPDWAEAERHLGLSAYNPALVGLFWGDMLARDLWSLPLFALALFACIAIDRPLRRLIAHLHLPSQSLAAVLVGWLGIVGAQAMGTSFWDGEAGQPPWQHLSLPIAVGGTLLAMLGGNRTGLLVAAACGGIAWTLDAPLGLWAFSVAPAAYAMTSLWLGGSPRAPLWGVVAALLAALLWYLWQWSPLGETLPPLLLPPILAIWLTLLLSLGSLRAAVLHPGVQELRRRLNAAGPRKQLVAISGAGISTASGIPDYVSGAWLDPQTPVSEYGYGRFLQSAEARRVYWDACKRFLNVTAASRPNPAHEALAQLEAEGWLRAVVTQNVDGLHQKAGAQQVIDLHGRIDHVECVACGSAQPWPADGAWRNGELVCATCGGLLKPAVTAMGQDLPAGAWPRAMTAMGGGGILLVVGSRLAVSTAAALVGEARRQGAGLAVINQGGAGTPLLLGDVYIDLPAEQVLPALCRLVCKGWPHAE